MTASRIFISLELAGSGANRTNFYPVATKIPPAKAARERNLAGQKHGFRRTVFWAADRRQQFRRAKLPGEITHRSGGAALDQHAAKQLGRVARADLAHDAGAITLDGARAQAQLARRFLVG